MTQIHRAQQLLLRRATVQQVGALWPGLDAARLDETYPAFATRVAAVVQANRATSAGLSAGYVRATRRAARVAGDAQIVLPAPLVVDQFSTSLRFTSVVSAKKAAADGAQPAEFMANAMTQTTGSMARLVLDAGRQTVVESVRADPVAVGWQRVLGGAGCEFCRMLVGRGAVYRADSADFPAHDHCGCSAEAIYP